jgi:hypothetical protein
MIKELTKCKKDILYFAENYFTIVNLDRGKEKIKLYGAQKRVLKSMVKNNRVVLLSSRQAGKALALDTPIPTPNGWTTMGNLKDNDDIYDENGNVCKVLKAHDILHGRECYKVTFDNGEEIIADGDHLWLTQTRSESQDINTPNGSVKSTKEILSNIYVTSDSKEPNHRIKKAKNIIHCEHVENVETQYHYIKNIEKVDSVPVRCITVDSPNSLYLCGKTYIPTHNTTLVTIFALHYCLFNNDKSVLVVANTEKTAIGILSRIRTAYELLPNYLKAGVKDYAKTDISFVNGSRIYVSTTATTAGRSGSINCLHGSETITIRNKKTKEILTIPIQDLKREEYI